jgi:hypothetical protein
MPSRPPLWRQLTRAAAEHAANSGDADYEIGDLHILFEAAFGLLSPAQRRRFFRLPEIVELLDIVEYRSLQGRSIR